MTSRALSLALVIAAVPAALVACADPPPPPATAPVATAPKPEVPPAPAPSASVAPAASASASAAPPPKKPEGAQPAPVVTYTGAFATPESVTWDEANDRYLVSNINGKPLDVDNNGYISELLPDGTVKTAKLVAGGVNKVTLNAPKGMAISAGVLYVADISVVRTFDAKTFAPKADIAIPGATFLNDVAAGPDGKIYVSDSGLKQGEKDFEPTGSDAVYVIEKGKAKPVAKSTDLGRPNGLLVDGKTLYVVTFGSGELYTLDAKGKKTDAAKLGQGALDGIVLLGDGSLLVSSWAGSEVLKGKAKSPFAAVVTGAKAPADIGYDKKRGRLLVPRFLEDKVEVFEVK
jgi:sugar lactone lactonase YvrE